MSLAGARERELSEIPEAIPETVADKIVKINNFKDGCEKSSNF